MANNINSSKGFSDFSGEQAAKRQQIKDIVRRAFESYGFEVAETPIIEFEEFVKGDNERDEAVRDIFKLEDRGKRKLALRYEFTFQLKRLAKNQKLPFKRYQIGYNFRDEPIREGRTRQFTQCDADIIGSSIKDEAEILNLGKEVCEKLGLKATMYVNNRKLINEILVEQKIPEKSREQVIRELDKLDKLSQKEVADNLKKINAEKVLKIFTGNEKSFEKYSYYKEIKELKKLCKIYGATIEFRPYLARGFSYYNGTVFEIWSKDLGVSLVGGGSYLIGETQGTGISFGLESLSLLANVAQNNKTIQIVSLDQDEYAIALAAKMRKKEIRVNLLCDKTISKALEYANAKKVEKVIIIGSEESKKKKYTLKNMKTGKEELLSEKELLNKI